MNIYEKLLIIQNKIKAPKRQYNKFGNYYYRNCEDILEGLKGLLFEMKLALILSDDVVIISNRVYIKSTAKLIDIESNNNNIIESYAYAREEESKKGMDTSQITGAASSYARKYALNGLFCIDDNKDSDSTNKYDEQIKKDIISKIKSIAVKTQINDEILKNVIKKHFNKENIESLTVKECKELINKMQNYVNKKPSIQTNTC